MEGVNYMDGSDIEETIFTPGKMTVEEWEELNDHRWYREKTAVDGTVEEAAGRIRCGEVFTSFNEFELCLDYCFNDFVARRNTPAFPRVCPDRPDLNLKEQVFSQQRKKSMGVKGGCGQKDRYDAAQMMSFSHADSDGDDLDEEDIESDEEDCDDDPKKVGRKTPSQGTRCE
ncbi:hypothetical protein R1sor_025346 [Riccia sorocarpa]|uniref:Uncharacterized protein n=1 Tax=Riccia sorocarpa TaxID=122646 RepID=A0ABD3G8W6_9MARC